MLQISDLFGCFDAAQTGHAAIHQNEIKIQISECFDSIGARGNGRYAASQHLEQELAETAVDGALFDNEYSHAVVPRRPQLLNHVGWRILLLTTSVRVSVSGARWARTQRPCRSEGLGELSRLPRGRR